MRVGSLFSGYGGLDLAVGGDLAWYSEIDPAACKVMESQHPGVPNLGDVTKIDWSLVEPVDVLTGGYPCQPFSHAGMRRGATDDRHLWPHVRDAIRSIRPRRVLLENVRGHLTLGFDIVLADLADLGCSARWGLVRASDVGAPHQRARLFILVGNSDSVVGSKTSPRGWGPRPMEGPSTEQRFERSSSYAADPTGDISHERPFGHDAQHAGGSWSTEVSAGGIDSNAADSESAEWRVAQPDHLVADKRATESGKRFGAAPYASSQRHGGREGTRGMGRVGSQAEGSGRDSRAAWQEPGAGSAAVWGAYATAIHRWESITQRPAPAPTVERAGRDRLSPSFVEWMMGLPEGWVTGHGLTDSQELKMLGNGVVPQQAALALHLLGGVA